MQRNYFLLKIVVINENNTQTITFKIQKYCISLAINFIKNLLTLKKVINLHSQLRNWSMV